AGCYHALAIHYPELLKVELPCEVLHLSQMLERLLREGALRVGRLEARAAYHDPCELGRLGGVYDPPRRVLESVEGLELVEPKLSRGRARCCGGGGGLWAYKSQVSMAAAELRLTKDIGPLGVDRLITACPACYMNFKYTSIDRSIPIEVQDLAELVLQVAERPR
ncbi:MAG: (Fe-S)-binding protein, partial [Candidatus Nezhaarchaeales archaeon]